MLSGRWGLAAGTYPNVDQYKITKHVTFDVPFCSAPEVWMRERESKSLSYANPNSGRPFSIITNITNTGFDLEYVAYFVPKNTLGQTINKWVPAAPVSTNVAYTAVGIPNFAANASISGSSLVCSSGASFTVDNLPAGATISWDQSSNLSRSSTQGSNPCTFASTGSGEGWIEATVTTDCGNFTLPPKTIWSGVPRPYWMDPYSVKHYDNVSNEYCYYEQEYITLQDDSPQEGNLSYTWIINDPDIVEAVSMNTVLFKANEVGDFWFHCLVTNTFGSKYIHFNMSVDYCYSFLLAITPNPSAGETTIAIEEEETNGHLGDKRSHKKEFDMNTNWDLEIYNPSQQLKYKKSKLKGKETRLNTSNWKEGVYVVRAKYNGEVLTGKLVVK